MNKLSSFTHYASLALQICVRGINSFWGADVRASAGVVTGTSVRADEGTGAGTDTGAYVGAGKENKGKRENSAEKKTSKGNTIRYLSQTHSNA